MVNGSASCQRLALRAARLNSLCAFMMDPRTDHTGGQDVIPAGQEDLVRRMVAPPLPEGWVFVSASINRREIHARYLHRGPPCVRAELRLASPGAQGDGGRLTGRFHARLLAPRAAPALTRLHAALVAAVRAEESAFVWAHEVPPAPATPPPPAPADGAPAEPPAALRAAQDAFAHGAFDDALDALAAFAAEAPAPGEALDALALRVNLMWQLGRYCEALEALDEALRRFPDSTALHTAGATLRAELHDDERAAAHARVIMAGAGDASGAGLRAATLMLSLGLEVEARQIADRTLAASSPGTRPSLLLDVAAIYMGLGAFDQASSLYARILALDPSNAAAHLAAGTLCAWRGEASGAEAHADAALVSSPGSAAGLCLRGAARMLRGEILLALEDLDRAAAADATDPVAAVWQGEALLRLGRIDEALEETRRGGELSDDGANHVAAQIVLSLAQLQKGVFPGMPEYVLPQALATLHADALPPTAPGTVRPRGRLEARLEEGLGRLRGNRSSTPTYVRLDGALVLLRVAPAPRVAAKRALWRLVATGSVAEALAAFDLLHAESPRAAEPYNYRGELFLYLGDAAAARAEFERAITLYPRSRWAYIGLAGAAGLEGRFEAVLEHLAEGIAQAGAPGPTTYVYRGEALRRLGRAEEARIDLDIATRRNPSRIGAWVNLALLHTSAGDLDVATRIVTGLRRRAPGFVADATAALGIDPAAALELGAVTALMEEMLTMLRGNRGSSCVTYFTRGDRLRAVPPSAVSDEGAP